MKILFFGAKSYDIKSFDAYLDKESYSSDSNAGCRL